MPRTELPATATAGATQPAENGPLPGHFEGVPVPSRRPPLFLITVLATALLVGGYFGINWLQYRRAYVSTDDAFVQGNVVTVSARVAGHIAQLLVDEGARMKAGQEVARLDDSDFKVQLLKAQAALATARAKLQGAEADVAYQTDQTQNQITRAQADLASAQASLNSAEAGLASARDQAAKVRSDFHRLTRLYRDGVISEQQAQAVQAALTTAEAGMTAAEGTVTTARNNLRSAQANLELAKAGKSQIAVRRATVRSDQAEIKQAEAAVAQAWLSLSYCTIKAPVSGQVARRAVNVGEHVQPGQSLYDITEAGKVWITAFVEETAIRRVRIGAPVRLTVDAYDRQSFTGRVTQIGSATGSQFSLFPSNNASGNFIKVVQRIPVRIDIDGRGYRLVPGMSAVVAIAAH